MNPATPVHLLDDVLASLDFVLIMSVNPGFGGQKLLPYTLDKIRRLAELREERGLSYRIEIDGGVTLDNLSAIVEAGCDIVVAGSSIFGTVDARAAFQAMRRRAEETNFVRV